MSILDQRLSREDSVWQLQPGMRFAEQPACASSDVDPEWFFPVSNNAGHTATAKQVCLSCPVRPACLDFALSTGPAGIWGGTTEAERAQIRRDSGADLDFPGVA